MKLAMYQTNNAGSMEQNLARSIAAIKEAAKTKADLILFPEVQLTEFFAQYPGLDVKKYGVTPDSGIVRKFQDASRENHIMTAPNIYLLEDGKYYDASLLIDKGGGIIGMQKMVHVAQAPQFYEQDYYTPSNEGFKVFDTEFGKIGLVICFDRHYPESIRTEALMGADLVLIPTANVKAEPLEMFEWEIRVQAFQNSVAVAMCNRVGIEGNMEFAGESIVIDAEGNCILKGNDSEQILYAEVDMSRSEIVRKAKPYTDLRRPEFYK